VELRADQLVQETERLAIVDRLVVGPDDAHQFAGVGAKRGLVARPPLELGGPLPAVVVGPRRTPLEQDRRGRDGPPESGLVERLV
jgi:hypothetical protein